MRRVENWPSVLSGMLRGQKDQPFAWGTNDCLMFPADIVKALTGFDPAADLRGTYSTEREAMNIIAAAGSTADLIDRQLGFKGSRKTLSARRGDVVIMKTVYGIMGGVVDDSGARIAVPISDQKTLTRFPLTKAWRVWSY